MTSSKLLQSSAALWLVAAASYLACEAVAAAAFPGYRYTHNYISALGNPVAENHTHPASGGSA